jgi:ATP-binding cassette subfamily B protein
MSALSSHVQENLSGMHVVKAYTQEGLQTHQFIALNDDFQAKSLELARMRGIITPVMQGFNALTVLIVLWYGGVRVIRGDLLVADIVAFVAYLNVLAWPTAAFGWMLSLVERGRAAMKRLEEILKTEPEIASPATSLPVRGLKQGIEFRDVSFVYGRQNNGHPTLEGINFSLPVGRSVGLVGRIGRGRQAQLVPRSSMCHPANSRGRKDIESLSSASCAGLSVMFPGPISLFDVAATQFGLWPGRSLR